MSVANRCKAGKPTRFDVPHWGLAEEASVLAAELARAFIADLEPHWRHRVRRLAFGRGRHLIGAVSDIAADSLPSRRETDGAALTCPYAPPLRFPQDAKVC
jgi:hypothetical protein